MTQLCRFSAEAVIDGPAWMGVAVRGEHFV